MAAAWRSSCSSTARSAGSCGTTNTIESVNDRIRKAVKAYGHFPNEQAALQCIYLAVMASTPTARAEHVGPNDGNRQPDLLLINKNWPAQ